MRIIVFLFLFSFIFLMIFSAAESYGFLAKISSWLYDFSLLNGGALCASQHFQLHSLEGNICLSILRKQCVIMDL